MVARISHEEAMRIRRVLWKWGKTLHVIARKERDINDFVTMINTAYDTIRATKCNDMPHAKSHNSSSVERALEAVEKRKEMYEGAIDKLSREIFLEYEFKSLIDDIVNTLDSTTQDILRMRYTDNHQWEYVALRTCFDLRHVQRLERKAVEKIAPNVTFDVI